jgi:hypothetical protein
MFGNGVKILGMRIIRAHLIMARLGKVKALIVWIVVVAGATLRRIAVSLFATAARPSFASTPWGFGFAFQSDRWH